MFGPRNSVVRTLLGEDISLDEFLTDQSELVDSSFFEWHDVPEGWVDQVHDYVHVDP